MGEEDREMQARLGRRLTGSQQGRQHKHISLHSSSHVSHHVMCCGCGCGCVGPCFVSGLCWALAYAQLETRDQRVGPHHDIDNDVTPLPPHVRTTENTTCP